MRYRLIGALLLALAACGGNVRAPVVDRTRSAPGSAPVTRVGERTAATPSTDAAVRGGHYVVQRGDSLYSIAWRLGLDYRDLARWNSLRDPDVIYAGQRLRVVAPRVYAPSRTEPLQTQPPRTEVAAIPPASVKPTPAPSSARKITSPAAPSETQPRFQWPTQGRVEPAMSAMGTRGLRIFGARGQAINAAAGGEVVYSGSGLRGYGKLIIVKHDAEFLSAYAHNESVFVEEGATVVAGQEIAEMGDSDAGQTMLYFEIRRDGVAVEPLEYLPADGN